MPAEECVKLIVSKLDEFHVNIDNDIISLTTDGPRLMQKVGRFLGTQQQLCLAHAIQLGIVGVLYKRQMEEPTATCQEDVDLEMEETNSDMESNEQSSGYFEVINVDEANREPVSLGLPNVLNLITKIRKNARLFKKSPVKNDDALQKYVKEDFKEEKSLILDCETRWSNLANMLKRFDELKFCVRKVLIDLRSDISFNDQEMDQISMISSALEPIKTAVEVLCRRDATLLTAETTLRFMIQKLESQNAELGQMFSSALKAKIMQRRTNVWIVDLSTKCTKI